MRKPFLSRVALPVFSWALPFHIVAMAALFGVAGLPSTTVRSIAAWKEIAVAILLVIVVSRAVGSGKPKMRLSFADLAVLGLLAVALTYLLIENSWLGARIPAKTALYGIRDISFFTLLYFVGRATPEIADDWKALRRFFRVAWITSVIAILEMIFVTPQMLVALGTTAYFQDFLGLTAFTTTNEYGLPMSYWSRLGHHDVRRAGSVYLGGQGFAVPFLLLMPIATVWVFGREKRPGWLSYVGYATIWIGLLLTLTRMTIVACAAQVLAYILLRKKPALTVAAIAVAGFVFVLASMAVPGLLSFIWDTITWGTGSSATHLSDWTKGVLAFATRPWGYGLGTADLTATRAGLIPLTADNQFLKYAVELGVAGLLAHLAIFAAVGWYAWRLMRSPVASRRALGTVVILATFGILLNAITAVVFNAMVLSYFFFWLAGSAVSASQLEHGEFWIPTAVLRASRFRPGLASAASPDV